MTMNDRITTVVGTFDDRGAAERAIEQLRDAGFNRDQVGYAGQGSPADTALVEEHGNASGAGAAGGVVTGAVAGGAVAWLGLAAIPAIGPFLAAGAIGSALLAAAAGGVTGGVLGGLLGLGIPRHKAEYHEEQIRGGRMLVTVQTAEPAIAERIFSAAGAVEVDRGDDEAVRQVEVRDADAAAVGSVAVPQHEAREAGAYRDAGVATAAGGADAAYPAQDGTMPSGETAAYPEPAMAADRSAAYGEATMADTDREPAGGDQVVTNDGSGRYDERSAYPVGTDVDADGRPIAPTDPALTGERDPLIRDEAPRR